MEWEAYLEMALGVEEQVLWLDITVGDALTVEIVDTAEDLLETTLDLARGHVALLDGGVEVSTGTELHDFAPVLLLVLDEVDCLDDVDVVEGGRYTELGS